MGIVLIMLVAAMASLLTFFSGFGLGTLLLPAFLLFYPVDIAIGLTAIVHLCNGLFKTGLIGRHASMAVLLQFGIPAVIFAFAGAWSLIWLSNNAYYFTYTLGPHDLTTGPLKMVIGGLLLIFAVFEILPFRQSRASSRGWLWLGGMLSGFFGGLSGHQGALRSAFLIRVGLHKETFIATGILIALCIDLTRLPVYLTQFDMTLLLQEWQTLLAATLAAFAGAYLGRMLLKKVTLHFVQYIVGIAVAVIGVALGMGIV